MQSDGKTWKEHLELANQALLVKDMVTATTESQFAFAAAFSLSGNEKASALSAVQGFKRLLHETLKSPKGEDKTNAAASPPASSSASDAGIQQALSVARSNLERNKTQEAVKGFSDCAQFLWYNNSTHSDLYLDALDGWALACSKLNDYAESERVLLEKIGTLEERGLHNDAVLDKCTLAVAVGKQNKFGEAEYLVEEIEGIMQEVEYTDPLVRLYEVSEPLFHQIRDRANYGRQLVRERAAEAQNVPYGDRAIFEFRKVMIQGMFILGTDCEETLRSAWHLHEGLKAAGKNLASSDDIELPLGRAFILFESGRKSIERGLTRLYSGINTSAMFGNITEEQFGLMAQREDALRRNPEKHADAISAIEAGITDLKKGIKEADSSNYQLHRFLKRKCIDIIIHLQLLGKDKACEPWIEKGRKYDQLKVAEARASNRWER